MRKKRKGVDQVNLDEKEIIRLYNEELLSVAKIAKKLSVNFATIKLRLVRNNVKLRTHSEQKFITMNEADIKEKTSEASKRSSQQRMETNIERYGSTVPSNAPEKREKWQQEYLEEHGIEWNKDPSRMEKSKATCMERYGVDNGSKADEAREKISQHRWKDKTEEELEEIWNKTVQTWLTNFNKDNPLKDSQIKENARKNRWENKTKEELLAIKEKTQEHVRNRTVENVLKKVKERNIELIYPFKSVTEFTKVKCLLCDNEFFTVLDYIFHNYGKCPKCFPKNESKWELEVKTFIESFVSNTIKNNRKIIFPYELDIYLPDFELAIECNGVYYHSEARSSSPQNYHLDKTIKCNQNGIRLIHIFEDEWNLKQEIVKNRLKQILNSQSATRIHARQCTIREIDSVTKNNFLDQYHIQGKDNSVIKLGAFYNNELISVMTFSHGNIAKGSKPTDDIWELNRFCSNYNYHIPGIAGKLLEYFKTNYIWKQIFSYADRRWSDGNLYRKLGFSELTPTKPNYWYIKGLQRIYRFNLRKRPDEPKDIPEWVLRQAEGYFRIWDCGHLKFELTK